MFILIFFALFFAVTVLAAVAALALMILYAIGKVVRAFLLELKNLKGK